MSSESGLPPARRLYDRVQQERNERGWTMTTLAKRSGVDRVTISRWRDSTGQPSPAKVKAVADALGIPHEELLNLAGLPTPPQSPAERALEDAVTAPQPIVSIDVGDAETEALLAKLPARRRQMLEEIRETERRRLERIAERVTAEAEEANRRFAELVRIQAEESDISNEEA